MILQVILWLYIVQIVIKQFYQQTLYAGIVAMS